MASDAVRIMCPNLTCRKVLAVPASARGKTVRCKSCGTSIKVPGVRTETDASKTNKPTGNSSAA